MNLIAVGKHQVPVAGTCLFVQISLMIKLAASQVCCLSRTMNRTNLVLLITDTENFVCWTENMHETELYNSRERMETIWSNNFNFHYNQYLLDVLRPTGFKFF